MHRPYEYVGPADLKSLVRAEEAGRRIGSPADFEAWVSGRSAGEFDEPFTFVVDLGGSLRLSPRRSEHVVCAAGAQVSAAGEIGFERRAGSWAVVQVSNQSTGFCPDLASWTAVADAIDRAGLDRPAGFTDPVVFRRCLECAQVNVVKEGFFVCVFCEGDLPAQWNIDPVDAS